VKKTLKKRLALEHDTLRALTEAPETKRRHPPYGPQPVTPHPSSQVQTCPAGSTGPCGCQ